VTADELDRVDEDVEREMASVVEDASNAPFPEPEGGREFKGG